MKKIIINGLLLFFFMNGYAQQYPLFSNYYLNSFGFNPAIAGSTICPEVRAMYRNQWAGIDENPETQIVSGHGRLRNLPIGLGGYFFNDEAGKIRRTGGSIALSFVRELDDVTKVSVGLGTGFYQINVRDQYRAEMANDLTIMNALEGMNVWDFSAGVYLQRRNWYVGFSVPQILEPQLEFDNDDLSQNELVRHYYGMAGYRIDASSTISVEPAVLVKFLENAPLQWEATARAFYKNKYWAGVSYRSENTIVAMAGLDLSNNLMLAYAFDVTTSNLNNASNGTHEITLGYRFCKKQDRDGDGVLDKDDKCPDEPGPAENDGCPERPIADNTDNDKDKDGITDDLDECPDIAGSLANNGCPIDDRDKDGIVDWKDKCPDVAGPLALEGCPGTDTDRDGVVDASDDCPDVPGPLYNRGCPPAQPQGMLTSEMREAKNLAIRNVYFDVDKDEIKKQYFAELDRLAEYLVKNPDWQVHMTGHTDERASDEYNDALSKRRVEAVMFYLINRGANRSQIEAEYYGESYPEMPDKTEADYQLNRRVELNLTFK